MTTPVFLLNDFIDLPVKQGRQFANLSVSLGDGYFISANNNQTFTGADGRGGVTTHIGLRQFQITLNMMDYANGDSTKALNMLEQFYDDTVGCSTAFYFYNPLEAPVPDPTGASTTGRYLCRFPQPPDPTQWFSPLRHQVNLVFQEAKG